MNLCLINKLKISSHSFNICYFDKWRHFPLKSHKKAPTRGTDRLRFIKGSHWRKLGILMPGWIHVPGSPVPTECSSSFCVKYEQWFCDDLLGGKSHGDDLKLRIYPNKRQRQQLAQNFGCARFVLNQMLAMLNEHHELNNLRARWWKEALIHPGMDLLALWHASRPGCNAAKGWLSVNETHRQARNEPWCKAVTSASVFEVSVPCSQKLAISMASSSPFSIYIYNHDWIKQPCIIAWSQFIHIFQWCAEFDVFDHIILI